MVDAKTKLKSRLGENVPLSRRMIRDEAIKKCLCVRFDPDMGFRLGLIRGRMNMRQEDMAKRLGVSRQALQKVESGKTALSNIGYLQLKSVLDMPSKNYFSFLFMGPPKEIWFEFHRFVAKRQTGMKPAGTAGEIIHGYEMLQF